MLISIHACMYVLRLFHRSGYYGPVKTSSTLHVLIGKQKRGHIGSNEIQTHPGSVIQDCIIVAMNRTPKINASAPF